MDMSKHGGYHGLHHGLQHCMFFSENKWTSWSTMKSWDGRFFRHIQCPKIYTKPVTQKDTGGYSTMLRAKILHDFLNGALTISHLKLTQHCTSNLPQSSQHVKCNADCWSGCFTESHSLTSCCLPRTASIWNNYRIFTLRGSVLLAR